MKRRDFLTAKSSKRAKALRGTVVPPKIHGVLDEYAEPLDRKQALHMLRRLTFAPTPEMIDDATGKTPKQILESLLPSAGDPLPQASGEWTSAIERNPLKEGNLQLRFEIEGKIKSRYRSFIDWWINLMRTESTSAREKLTLFLSTIWTIEFTYDTLALIPPPLMLRNNQTLREHILGDYKTIAEKITLDGAMLLYQSLYYSSGDAPNENYMREMMELFSMGTGDIKTGERNYTEGDIKNGTRALTGWRSAAYDDEPAPKGNFETYFVPDAHDCGEKTFMGTTIPARDPVAENTEFLAVKELQDLIGIMFDVRGASIGRFIVDKVYRYFVYGNPFQYMLDFSLFDELKDWFITNNYELKALYEKLFTSRHFFDENLIGVKIKTPPEFIVGLQTQLGINYDKSREAIFELEQVLYDPPDVGSWAGYRAWISVKTYPRRVRYAQDMLEKTPDSNLFALAKKFANYTDFDSMLDSLNEYFLPIAPTSEKRARLEALFSAAAAITIKEAWADIIENETGAAANALRTLINEYFLSPEFNLC